MSEWRAVVGWDGRYEVRADGAIRSLPREAVTTRGLQRWPGKILLPFVDTNGYLYINLCDGKRSRKMAVHRVVLLAFVGPPGLGQQACHNNGIRTDPSAGNLRWGSLRENAADRDLHGTSLKGERSPKARLTTEQVRVIRESTETSIALGKRFGVAHSTVRAVRLRQNWKHL